MVKKTDAEKYTPTAGKITVDNGTKLEQGTPLTEDQLATAIPNHADLPNGTTYTWKDTVTVGNDTSSATVVVTYPDQTSEEVLVLMEVKGTYSETYQPKLPTDKVKVDDKNNLTEDEKTTVKTAVEDANKDKSGKSTLHITVGEDGMHYLKVLCDQIFSPENYVGTLPRKTRDGKSDVPFNFSQDFDWILVYTKTTNSDKAIVGRKVQRKYYETPDFPGRKWRTADLTKQTTTKERPNSDFTMVNPKTGRKYPVNPNRSWAVSKYTFKQYYDQGGIGFPDDYDFMRGHRPFRRVFKDEDDRKDKESSVSSDLLLKNFIKTLLAKSKTTKKDEYVKKQQFNYAKPEELMKQIISVASKEGDYVMDFFSGSGTTAAAALKMNRRFIAVEQIDEQLQLSKKRLNSVVKNEDKGGISKEVDWKGGSGFIYTELASKKENVIDQINAATTIDELTQITKLIGDDDYQLNIDINKVWQNLDQVTVNDVKNAMVDILEPAQLYVSALNADDPEEHISEKRSYLY